MSYKLLTICYRLSCLEDKDGMTDVACRDSESRGWRRILGALLLHNDHALEQAKKAESDRSVGRVIIRSSRAVNLGARGASQGAPEGQPFRDAELITALFEMKKRRCRQRHKRRLVYA
ncbi:hypothetical protein TEQG_06968 [Trichophyton equinum CBS 127.97]|uniref:Uncharacterized protein n=1 Tax=Trichophyton equinum (strain ATCC MYA-4606 / CBS 127.97) TaxID=559882 RepID=F2Q1B9_TRIEC|nr:hypothetical protein TEQG_06968 [Trichophyton equinum CBS 127.97]